MRSRVRRAAHYAVAAARGGRGVPVRLADGWRARVHPRCYEDLKFWSLYERGTVEALRRLWRPGACIVDVGAHHGSFSVTCLGEGGQRIRLLAVEPSPLALPALRANLAVYPGEAWTIHPIALGAAPGTTTMYVGWIHMLVPDPRLHPGGELREVTVEVRTLDQLCADEQVVPDVVKIDVEGLEADVLEGAAATLARGPYVLLEWHRDMIRERGGQPNAALAPLIRLEYGLVPIGADGPEGAPLHPDGLPRDPIVRLVCVPPGAAPAGPGG